MEKKTVNQITFGQRLAYARKQKGLSVRQFADLIEVPRSTENCWEKDKRHPKLSSVWKIIKALDLSDDWFGNAYDLSKINFTDNQEDCKLTREQQKLVADNERIIGCVLHKFLHKFRTKECYEYYYGYAAIGLCQAARQFDKNGTVSFFSFAFQDVKWAVYNANAKRKRDLQPSISLNQIVGNCEDYDEELGSLIQAPDEFEPLEYKILVESVCQKVEPALTVEEKEALRLWLHGKNSTEISRAMNIGTSDAKMNIQRAKKKCKVCFSPDEIFS